MARGAARLVVLVRDEREAEAVGRAGGMGVPSLDGPALEEAFGSLRRVDAGSLGLNLSASADGATLLLDTGPERLLDKVSFPDLSGFAARVSDSGAGLAFAGRLEAPDVPRLLPLRPAFLAFDEAVRDGSGRLDPSALAALAALFAAPPVANAFEGQPDKVFVRDLIVDMELGAYASERGRRQRVRFSVEAEIVPPAGPWAAADIYSYDRMMDAIRSLARRAPEPFVETLAETLAGELLEDPRLIAVTVRVEKLDLGPGSAGVEIRRIRRS